jgi:putative transposase
MQKSYKYKLRLNAKFADACEATLESCRFLYNSALSQRISHYRQGRGVGFLEQSRQLTEARELPEVGRVLRSFQENTLRQLDRAYGAFFRRVKSRQGKSGFPRFKGQGRFDSFNTTDARAFRLDGDKLTIQKLGSCRIRLSRPLGGTPKTLTVRKETDGWFVVIVCDVQAQALPLNTSAVGVDVGLESFATLSTGVKIINPRFFRKGHDALSCAQQRLALKKKGSNSRKRARRLVARAHAKVRRQRDWFQWQEARRLVQCYGRIAVEKLNVKGMAQSNLAKSIHDVGWTSFIAKLTSKAEEAGRELVKVSARFTSQDCSDCGLRKKKDLSERWHSCPCGLELDRDVNAARNILAKAWPDLKIESTRA